MTDRVLLSLIPALPTALLFFFSRTLGADLEVFVRLFSRARQNGHGPVIASIGE